MRKHLKSGAQALCKRTFSFYGPPEFAPLEEVNCKSCLRVYRLSLIDPKVLEAQRYAARSAAHRRRYQKRKERAALAMAEFDCAADSAVEQPHVTGLQKSQD